MSTKRLDWRDFAVFIGTLAGVISCIAAIVVVPEVRKSLGLNDNPAETSVISPTQTTFISATSTSPTKVTESTSSSSLPSGKILMFDNFEDAIASGLGESEDEDIRYAYENGAYVIEVKKPEQIAWARVNGEYNDVRVDLDTHVPIESGTMAPGLIFHYQDANNFFLYSISNDGYYTLEVYKDGKWEVLIDWTKSEAINSGSNRMRIDTQGNKVILYVNDKLLTETRESTFYGGGIGMAVTSLRDSKGIVLFENIIVTQANS
jgi:hypothetical protein